MFAFLIRNKNLLIKTIKLLLYLSLLMPIVVGINYLFPYVFPKAIFFMALVEIAFVLYVLLLVIDKNYLPQLNLLLVGLEVWLASLTLSTFLAVDPSLAFWSKAERMDGLFWYLHLFLFLVMVIRVFQEEMMRFLTVVSLTGGVVGVVALISKYFPFLLNLGNQDRLAGSFGNPAFLATYFLVLFFLNLIAYFLSQDAWKKIFLVLAGFSFLLVFLSGTRGAYVGLLGGLGLFGLLVLLFQPRKYLRAVLVGFGALLLLLGSFYFLPGLWQKLSPFLASRIYALWEIPKPRLIAWQIGWNAFLERPIWGWGLENFLYAFNQHFIPEIHTYEAALFDRPHNKIIDLLVTQGIVGLLIYLFLFGGLSLSFLRFLWRHRDEEQKVLVYSLFLGLLGAYFVQNLVLFEMPTSGLVLFIVLALAYWLIQEERIQVRELKFNQGLSSSFFFLALVLLSGSFYFGIFLPERASRNTANAAFSLLPNQVPTIALENFREFYLKARQKNTFLNKEIDISLSRRLRDFSAQDISIGRLPQYQEVARLVLENLKKDLALHPRDYDLAVEAGSLVFQLEESYQDKSNEDSEAYNLFTQATNLAAKREEAYQYLFLWSLKNNKPAEAKRYSEILLNLNDQIGVFWFYQAEYEARWGSLEKMNQAREKAEQLGYQLAWRVGDWELLISSLILSGRKQAAIAELEKLVALAELPPQFLIRDSLLLIQLYVETGNKLMAKKQRETLLTQVPSQYHQKIIDYLKQNSWWVE